MMQLRHATRTKLKLLLLHPSCFHLRSQSHQTYRRFSINTHSQFSANNNITMEDPKGTILFTTIGRPHYGFDVFSLQISSPLSSEHRLTDGVSINFNAQFVDDHQTLVFVSERSGSSRIYLTQSLSKPKQLPSVPTSLFHDRPIVKNDRLYFISAHEQPNQQFKSWSALYSAGLDSDGEEILRLTPHGVVDYSPAVSQSGELVAVASYGSRPWGGEFHELHTDIVVFRVSDPTNRFITCERGGWPTWSGDSTIYFHRQADDGWWSIFRIDLTLSAEPEPGDESLKLTPLRITPAGVHCFTPAAMHDGKRIAVATRRRGNDFRHIEIFDTESSTFHPVTESLNPNLNHYNPFVSPDSQFLGYHRFRGESAPGDSTVPHLEPVASPVNGLRMLRLNGSFPSSSPDGDLIAINRDFDLNPGVMIVKSDGSKRWSLVKGRTAFYNSWSPTEKHVIYTSLGPIFQSAKATVQIARISFDPSHVDGNREEITSTVKILTKEETGNNAFPACSPDGESIVFRSGRSGHKNLYVIDAVNGEFDGGCVRRLTEGPWIDTMPSWSPRGDFIAFSSNMHNPQNDAAFSIYVVKPNGSDLRRIKVTGDDCCDRERINHVCFSRDGEWLLFTANLGGVTAEPVSWPNQFQPYGDLYVARQDGSGLRRLTWNGYENGTPAWHSVDDVELGMLRLGDEFGEKLRGEFDEPLWISCDI